MKTFNHPQLPLGCITDSQTLRSFLDAGQIHDHFVLDDGNISNCPIRWYLDHDDQFFIHSEQGFIWWMSHIKNEVVMANRRLELVFYTHIEEDHDSDFKLPPDEYDSLTT